MKKLSKIHITNSIFISTNVLTLMFQIKTANATPTGYLKLATRSLLVESVRSPSMSFIQKLSNGKLKASFLHTGQRNLGFHNFNVKAGSTVGEKRDNGQFKILLPTTYQKRLVGESTHFKILTSSRKGFSKEINILREGENIVVTSEKGIGSSQHVLKRTVLDFGNEDIDGPSTSAQASAPLSEPTITVTRHSISNGQSQGFDTETIAKYEVPNLKLISHVTKIKSPDKLETVTQYEDGTKSKIIEHIDGRESSFMFNHLGETLFSNEIDNNGDRVVITRLNTTTYSKLKYSSTTKKLIEKTNITPTVLESEIFDNDGNLTSTTKVNKIPTGETIETTKHSNGYTTIHEKRQDGSLLSITTHSPSGESFKQDFDSNNLPINSPYRIN